jgi:hypothetical protein
VNRRAAAVLIGGLAVACSSTSTSDAPATTTTTTAEPAAVEALAVRWSAALSGPTSEDDIDGVGAAPDGSVYVTGKFERSASLGGAVLDSAGRADIPVARFGPDGDARWVQRFGGPGEDNLFDLDADEHGAVGTGWFEGTVELGDVTLTSAGASDCVVVALDDQGGVRWARAIGGPFREGCNEVTIAPDGGIVTSLDTEGGWRSPAGPIPRLTRSDTVLLRLTPEGEVDWARRVGGPGAQRGKSLAVGPDGTVAFGGDSIGPLDVDGEARPAPGGGRDAWFGLWSPDGRLEWTAQWGGPGDDLAKGLAFGDDGVYAVGPFVHRASIGDVNLDAGDQPDLAVARLDLDGTVDWATTVTADGGIPGTEITAAADGGVLFGGTVVDGLRFVAADGTSSMPAGDPTSTGWLVHYRPDGSVGLATAIPGMADGRPGEIARVGDRVYLDAVVRGPTKDSAVWALDLPAGG